VQFFPRPRNLNSGIIMSNDILAILFMLLSTQRNFSRLLDYPGTNFGTCRHACLHWTSLDLEHSALSIVSWMIFAVRCSAPRVPHSARNEDFVSFCVVTVLPGLSHRSTSLSITCPYRQVQDLPGRNCQSFSRNRSRLSFRQHTIEGRSFWIFGFGFSHLHSF